MITIKIEMRSKRIRDTTAVIITAQNNNITENTSSRNLSYFVNFREHFKEQMTKLKSALNKRIKMTFFCVSVDTNIVIVIQQLSFLV